MPPGGRPPRGSKPTALDEFLRRARGGGGPGGPGGGFGGLPGGPAMRGLWIGGAVVIVALWVLFTSVHQIAPQQRGVVTFFGRYAGTLAPGINLTLPAPIAAVKRVDVEKIRDIYFPAAGTGQNLVLTGDQNIVDLSYKVSWNVNNPQDYSFELADPDQTVAAVAEAAMRAVMATVTLDEAIGAGRAQIAIRVRTLMQQILNDYHSGVSVTGVDINNAAAPEKVRDDFKLVSAAQQEAQSNLNRARSAAQQITARAEAEAKQFDLAYEQYKLAPDVTRRRMYYETMEAVLAKQNKVILEAPGVAPYLPLPGMTPRAPEADVVVSPPGGKR
ncbi:MAG: protease modulator HflK [Sphingomonas sp.]|nr:protease modulator HflK [Sphingomonas sp.]